MGITMLKKTFRLFLLFLLAGTLSAEQITVYRDGNDLLVQSRWSEEKDLVIHVSRFANEASYLVRKDSDIRQYSKGERLHLGWDDYPAILFAGGQGYGYLGGNHGSAFGVTVTLPEKSFSEKDIGTELTDESGNRYLIIQVPSPDRILIHPESKTGTPGRPKFPRLGKKKLFRNGVELKYVKAAASQVYPMNRITRFEYLIDGKEPLPEKKVVKCSFVDQIFEHDVIAPEGMLDLVRKNPGRKPSPEFSAVWNMVLMDRNPALRDYAALPAAATIRNRYRYQPRGAVVNERNCTFHFSFHNVSQQDQMFGWSEGKIAKAELQEFYIPKTKTVQMRNMKDKTAVYHCDFSRVQLLPRKMNVSYTLKLSDSVDPEDPPDRFIRLSGNGKREYGLALGMSLFAGHTAKANKGKDRSSLYYFYPTGKLYPYSYILTSNEPGITLKTVSYKQYFNPQAEPDLTSFYCHRQVNSDVVYMDCHKPLKNKILTLPESARGKKITVLEQSPSVKFMFKDRIPDDGKIAFDVEGQGGSFVLKLDDMTKEN